MDKLTKKNRIISIISFIFMITGVIIYAFFLPSFDFKKDGKYGVAEIYDFNVLANSNGYSVCYKYFVNNKQYKNNKADGAINSELSVKLRGCYFPILYIPENPQESVILITKYDFEHYNVIYPDSLKWVEDYR